MLKKLLELVKENAGDAIINNPAVPNEKNDAVIQSATNSLFKALKGTANKQGIDSIRGLFQQGAEKATSSPEVNNISANVAGELMKKFGLDKGAATSIVASLIPVVLSKLISKTNDPKDDSFGLDDIIGSLAGGKSGGLLSSLKGLLGR